MTQLLEMLRERNPSAKSRLKSSKNFQTEGMFEKTLNQLQMINKNNKNKNKKKGKIQNMDVII